MTAMTMRAIDDPVLLARAARIVRAALARKAAAKPTAPPTVDGEAA